MPPPKRSWRNPFKANRRRKMKGKGSSSKMWLHSELHGKTHHKIKDRLEMDRAKEGRDFRAKLAAESTHQKMERHIFHCWLALMKKKRHEKPEQWKPNLDHVLVMETCGDWKYCCEETADEVGALTRRAGTYHRQMIANWRKTRHADIDRFKGSTNPVPIKYVASLRRSKRWRANTLSSSSSSSPTTH